MKDIEVLTLQRWRIWALRDDGTVGDWPQDFEALNESELDQIVKVAMQDGVVVGRKELLPLGEENYVVIANPAEPTGYRQVRPEPVRTTSCAAAAIWARGEEVIRSADKDESAGFIILPVAVLPNTELHSLRESGVNI